MGDDRDLGRGLVLRLENGIITGVEGEASVVMPPSVTEPVGTALLDLVHPVDRPTIGDWLDRRVGASPPFRRAHPDDTVRWLRVVAAEPGPGHGATRVYLEDVSEAESDVLRRRRLTSILARESGQEFLNRVPRIAAEAVGASHGLLAEVHGPVVVVRSSFGDGLPAPGAAVAISGDPIEGAVISKSLRTFEDGLQERFPNARFSKVTGASSGAVVPAGSSESHEVAAVLFVLNREPHRYSLDDAELLELIAARVTGELRREGQGESSRRAGDPSMHFSPATLELAGRGVSNAFGNLLSAIGLNLELAAAEPDLEERAHKQLERALESVERGRWLVRAFDRATAYSGDDRRAVSVERSIETVAGLLRLCVDGFRVSTSIPEDLPSVWGTDRLVLGVLLQYLLPISEVVRPQTGVSIDVTRHDDDGVAQWVGIELSAELDPREENNTGTLGEAVEAAQAVVDHMGARAAVSFEAPGIRVDLQLPAVQERTTD